MRHAHEWASPPLMGWSVRECESTRVGDAYGWKVNSISPALWLSLRVCLVIWSVSALGRAALRRYTLTVAKCRFLRVSLCAPAASGSGVAENSVVLSW
jgi:hypothetical protein